MSNCSRSNNGDSGSRQWLQSSFWISADISINAWQGKQIEPIQEILLIFIRNKEPGNLCHRKMFSEKNSIEIPAWKSVATYTRHGWQLAGQTRWPKPINYPCVDNLSTTRTAYRWMVKIRYLFHSSSFARSNSTAAKKCEYCLIMYPHIASRTLNAWQVYEEFFKAHYTRHVKYFTYLLTYLNWLAVT